MSVEIQHMSQVDPTDNVIDAVKSLPTMDEDAKLDVDAMEHEDVNVMNPLKQKLQYEVHESSPSPSPCRSQSSSTSLMMMRTDGARVKHPLSASYKEWIFNWFSISIPAIGFLGCQLSLALQNGFVTPELEELGISEKLVAYCWLAPPLTGTIVQPLIGITSDMMDPSDADSFAGKYGRRRPFVALGCVMVVIFLLLFSNARYIGLLFGDTGEAGSTSSAAIVAVVSFWFLDISINIVQAPLRALVSDIIPSKHHTTANGVFGFANGLGAIIGYALGYGMAYNPALGGGLSSLFGVAALTVICTSSIMLYLTRGEQKMAIYSVSLSEIIAKNYATDSQFGIEEEALLSASAVNPIIPESAPSPEPHLSDLDVVVQAQRSKFERIRDALRTMPRPISRAYVVQFWLYFGLFASYIYLTDWFGKRVTHGSPDSLDPEEVELYRYGVRIASIGLSFGAIFAVIGSMCLPVIISKCGYRWTWFFCMLFYGVMLLMTPFCDTINMGLLIVTCLGIGQAAAMVIGWSIVTETVAHTDQKGVYTTLFTTSHTVPELVVALIAGEIIFLFDNHVSAVLAVGGVAALFGANSALYVVEPKKWLAKQAWLKRQNRVLQNRQMG
eukprot:33123_1